MKKILLSALSFSSDEYERMPLILDTVMELPETRPETRFSCK